jgi:hypothetical protein
MATVIANHTQLNILILNSIIKWRWFLSFLSFRLFCVLNYLLMFLFFIGLILKGVCFKWKKGVFYVFNYLLIFLFFLKNKKRKNLKKPPKLTAGF